MRPRLTIVCAAVLLTSCAPRHDVAECSKSWNEMETPAGQEERAMVVILHYDWPRVRRASTSAGVSRLDGGRRSPRWTLQGPEFRQHGGGMERRVR
jgi:hypothetical protein